MVKKLFSCYTVEDSSGKEFDISSLLRFIAEMTQCPSLFVKDNISWKKINAHSAEISVKAGDVKVSGIFNFNNIGEIISFTTDDSYMNKNKIYVKEKWTVKFSDYRDFGGLKVPTKSESEWNLLSGDLLYIKTQITEAEYDIFKAF